LPEKARVVKQALNTKGFKEDKKRDHFYYFLFHENKKTEIFTKVSHSASEIDDKLFSMMARQIRLSSGQFREFVDCALTYDKYIGLLVTKNILEKTQATVQSQSQQQSKKQDKRPSR